MIPAARGWRGNYPLYLPLAQGEDGIAVCLDGHRSALGKGEDGMAVYLGGHRSALGKGEEARCCCIAVLSRVRLSPCVRGSRWG